MHVPLCRKIREITKTEFYSFTAENERGNSFVEKGSRQRQIFRGFVYD